MLLRLPDYKVDNYYAYWLKLNQITNKQSGEILDISTEITKPMYLNAMAKYLNISLMTCKRFIKESVEIGVITKHIQKDNSYRKNIYTFNSGYIIGEVFEETFY